MAQTLEALTRRVETVGNIRGIVHTMKTVSAINVVPYENAARAIDAYHKTVLNGLSAFLHRHGKIVPENGQNGTHVVVVFGSDHGLCGSYNEVLAAKVAGYLKAPDRIWDRLYVLCIGAQMNDALAGQNIRADSLLLPPASADGIGRLAAVIVARLDEIRLNSASSQISASLAFTKSGENGRQDVTVNPLLPLAPTLIDTLLAEQWSSRSLPDFTMPAPDLLAALLQEHLFASIFRASADALATENAARLATMHRAEQTVEDRLAEIQADIRSMRQSEITTELLDIIIGFEALTHRRRLEKATQNTKEEP